jgi:asparagine synthase (glutamine-hydrolysing)
MNWWNGWRHCRPTKKNPGKASTCLFKKAMEPHSPNDVLYRPKMGFSVPLARWSSRPCVSAQDALMGERLRTVVQHGLPGASVHHRPAHATTARRIWTMLMFEAFLRQVWMPGPGW